MADPDCFAQRRNSRPQRNDHLVGLSCGSCTTGGCPAVVEQLGPNVLGLVFQKKRVINRTSRPTLKNGFAAYFKRAKHMVKIKLNGNFANNVIFVSKTGKTDSVGYVLPVQSGGD